MPWKKKCRSEWRYPTRSGSRMYPASVNIDADLLRLGLLPARQTDRQHAVLVRSRDLCGVHTVGQRERARECADVALDALILLALHADVVLALTLQREHVVLERHAD